MSSSFIIMSQGVNLGSPVYGGDSVVYSPSSYVGNLAWKPKSSSVQNSSTTKSGGIVTGDGYSSPVIEYEPQRWDYPTGGDGVRCLLHFDRQEIIDGHYYPVDETKRPWGSGAELIDPLVLKTPAKFGASALPLFTTTGIKCGVSSDFDLTEVDEYCISAQVQMKAEWWNSLDPAVNGNIVLWRLDRGYNLKNQALFTAWDGISQLTWILGQGSSALNYTTIAYDLPESLFDDEYHLITFSKHWGHWIDEEMEEEGDAWIYCIHIGGLLVASTHKTSMKEPYSEETSRFMLFFLSQDNTDGT